MHFYTSVGSFFNCCRQENRLGDPEFIADLPLDEIPSPPSFQERLGGYIVSTVYTLGAKYIAGKNFDKAREILSHTSGHELKTIKTGDGVCIDTAYIPGTVKKAVLLAPGLGDRFESLAIDSSLLKHIQTVVQEKLGDVTIMAVNVRGYGWSEGSFTPKRFHIDIYSAHQYLVKDKGFDPEDIYIYGESLGGCSGLRAASLVQKVYQDKKISAVTDRSFLYLEDVVKERTSGCYKGLDMKLVRCIEWDVDCEEEAKSLKGEILAIGARGDLTVPSKSFFGNQKGVKELKNLEVLYISGDDSSPDPHTRYWLPEEQEAVGDALRRLTS